MKKLKLSEIAAACGGKFNIETEVSDISTDTRSITPGSLFICLVGENFDAHFFINEAMAKGALAVMICEDIKLSTPYVKVENTTNALLMLAAYYRSLFDIPLVGITGSVGKTTAKELTYLALSAKYNTVKNEGNLNNEIGMPKTIFNIDEQTEAAVIEMGMNHFGEISRLSKAAKPSVAVITNIGVSHIENLGSREGILKAKLEILDGMSEGSTLILNKDNDLLSKVKNESYNICSFSIEKDSDFRAVNISENEYSTKFDICFSKNTLHTEIPMRGIHNVYNALSAFAAAVSLNVNPEEAAEKFKDYKPVGMRQRINKISGITVIEDCYNASPDSSKAALKMLSEMNGKRKFAVLGDMLELGDYSERAHREIGKTAAELKIDYILTIGEMSEKTDAEAKENGVVNSFHFDNKEDVENFLYNTVKDGDCILFKASRRMKLEDIMNSVYKRWKQE